MNEKKYDLIIKNLKVVKPQSENVEDKDIAIKDGKFAAIEAILTLSIQMKYMTVKANWHFQAWLMLICIQEFIIH